MSEGSRSADDSAEVLADELAIRGLVARYADAVNRRDEAAWLDTWTEGAVWELLGTRHEGRQAALAFLRAALGSLRFVVQLVHSGVVELDGDAAHGRWVMSEWATTQGGDRSLLLAFYHDRYAREAGQWRFCERRLQPLYQGPPDLTGHEFPLE